MTAANDNILNLPHERGKRGKAPKERVKKRQGVTENRQLERNVLASILLGMEEVWGDISKIVQPGDFYETKYRDVYEAMLALDARHLAPWDTTLIVAEVQRANGDAVGAQLQVSNLMNDLPTWVNGVEYARELAKFGIERAKTAASYDYAQGYSDDADLESMLAELRARERSLTGQPSTYFEGKVISAHELMALELPEVRWAVPNLFAEGLTILAAKPKQGKSTLALHVMTAVATGGTTLGKIDVEKGEALYLALEDNQRRMQHRLRVQLDEVHISGPHALHLTHSWRRIGEGCVEDLDAWMDRYPDTRIICIDTFKTVKPRSRGRGQSLYDEDYEALEPLQKWALGRGVAVVVVHHLRKAVNEADPFDEISGSTGLIGVADNLVVMRDFNGETTLYRRGRDYFDDTPWVLRGNSETLLWQIEGQPDPPGLTEERKALFEMLVRYPSGLTVGEIAARLGKKQSTVSMMLSRTLAAANSPLRKKGRLYFYGVSDKSDDSDKSDKSDGSDNHSSTIYHSQSDGGVINASPVAASPQDHFITPITHITPPLNAEIREQLRSLAAEADWSRLQIGKGKAVGGSENAWTAFCANAPQSDVEAAVSALGAPRGA